MRSFTQKHQVRRSKQPITIVISGASRGLGKSLAIEFAKDPCHHVFSLSRNIPEHNLHCKHILCDVRNAQSITDATRQILSSTNSIDIWINNAAQSGGSRLFDELENSKIEEITQTNLLGTGLSCKIVHEIMQKQPHGGAIFNVAGAGSNGFATPRYSMYGATKAAISQLTKSLQREWHNSNVQLHMISPGMMFTDLLLENMSETTFQLVEKMCSHSDEVATFLAPRIKHAYYTQNATYINYLSFFMILKKLINNGHTHSSTDHTSQ